jgi:DNA mismatch repair protein MutL
VHFLEPARVRGFIIKTLRGALAATMTSGAPAPLAGRDRFAYDPAPDAGELANLGWGNHDRDFWAVRDRAREIAEFDIPAENPESENINCKLSIINSPLGRVVGQIGNKYILAQNEQGLVIIDQHAAHERIIYEKLRAHEIKVQPLLSPIVIQLKPEQVSAVLEVADELRASGLAIEQFGEDAVAISEKPADWDLDWGSVLRGIADEVAASGHSSQLGEKLHLKLANYACHHSVRAGQKLGFAQMDALLRDIENTERAGQCNHGRPVWKQIPLHELDGWFERV